MASIIKRKSLPLIDRLADAEQSLHDTTVEKNDEAVRLAELAAQAKRDAETANTKRAAVAQAFEILAAANVDI